MAWDGLAEFQIPCNIWDTDSRLETIQTGRSNSRALTATARSSPLARSSGPLQVAPDGARFWRGSRFFRGAQKKLLGNRPASPKAHRACPTNPSRGLAEASPAPSCISYGIVTKNLLRKLGGAVKYLALSMNKAIPFHNTKRSPNHVPVLLK